MLRQFDRTVDPAKPAAASRESWLHHNHLQLQLALESVQLALLRHIERVQARRSIPEPEQQYDTALPAGSSAGALGTLPSALDALCAAYKLTPFERDVLVLCAGVELDAELHATCGAAQGLAGRGLPTWSLALAALPAAHWSALAPLAPLRRGCLIEVLPGESLTLSRLRIEERVLHHLTGLPGSSCLDQRLRGLVARAEDPVALAPSHLQLAQHIAGCVQAEARTSLKVLLCGPSASERLAISAAVCKELGVPLYTLSARELPAAASERELIGRLWEREVLLERPALLVQLDDDSAPGEATRAGLALLDSLPGLVLFSSRDGLRQTSGRVLRFDVPTLTVSEQRELWRSSLGPVAVTLNGQVERLLTHFNIGQSTIESVTGHALTHALAAREDASADDVASALWDACRMHARPRMDELAQRIDSRATWDDLVLPKPAQRVLRQIIDHKQHQATVHHEWGFARRGGRGLGLSALFAGTSGTGKTLAAEVLANELHLDLYRIDLSQVVSKYIGETEKNLRRVFEAAEQGGAILLFDEADALFGKRSEVRDSHDRYANIEVGYLLQRMETYQGISILTTNMKSSLDNAFLRRIRFIVHFPLPDTAQRLEIWRRVIPEATPTAELDLNKLARLNISGGHIQNIAMTAAFAAAAAGEPLHMRHLHEAAQLEYAKLEKLLTESEFGGRP